MGSVSIVRASAGSGKTYLLAVEYIAAALCSPNAFTEILAVTFTNKATAEMKHRILTELAGLARGEQEVFFESISQRTGYNAQQIASRASVTLSAILNNYSAFSVSTIDKFFQRIIRSFFRELGLDLRYQIQIDSVATLDEAIDSLIDLSANDIGLARKIDRLVAEQIALGARVDVHKALKGIAYNITSEQFAVSTADQQQIESVFDQLKSEYEDSVAQLKQIALTACRLIEESGLTLDDFKYKQSSFAAYFFRIVRGGNKIRPYAARFSAVAQTMDERLCASSTTLQRVRPVIMELMNLTAQTVQLYDQTLAKRSTFELISTSFSKYLLLRNLSDTFHSLLAMEGKLSISGTTKLIGSIVGQADVPFIFERLGNRYSTIFIDEFQDTSLGQWEGFFPLISEAVSKCDKRCVMLIGDIKQAIYRFRGGDWRLLGGVADRELDGYLEEPQSLVTSWRSERQIVDFNNSVMRSVVQAAQESIVAFVEGRSANAQQLKQILPNAYKDLEQILPKHRGDRGYVEVFNSCDDEKMSRAEIFQQTVHWAVSRVEELSTRYALSKVAILVRSKYEGAAITDALIEAGINFMSEELLVIGNSKTASFVVNIMKLATEPRSAITLASVNRFLGRPFTEPLTDQQQQIVDSIIGLPSIEAFEQIIRLFDLQQSEPFYLQSLLNLIYNYSISSSVDIGSFVDAWQTNLSKKTISMPPLDDAVQILTIHKSKGLEFDVVIVPFFVWELFPESKEGKRSYIWAQTDIKPFDIFNPIPIYYSKTMADSLYAEQYFEQGVSGVVDNVNLIYVALTRARYELYLGLNKWPNSSYPAVDVIGQGVKQYMEEGRSSCGVKNHNRQVESTTNQTILFDRIESYPMPTLNLDQN